MKKFFVAALLGAASISAPAAAATITYTYTSTFTGTNNGNPFTIDASFTGVGDTSDMFTQSGVRFVRLLSLNAVADGPYQILTPFAFGFTSDGIVGFSVASAPITNAFTFSSPTLIGYDGVSNVTAVTTSYDTGASFTTDRGNIVLTGQTDGIFSAAVASVPEPASWAMMIAGFGLIGGTLRRRRAQVRTSVSFA